MKKIIREPLLHFLLIGGLLFLVSSWVNKERRDRSQEIFVDNATVGRMIMQYEAQTGVAPTKQTLDALIDDHIREEVYYREALKVGLDKDDEVVRRRLSQKYAFLQNDLMADKRPTDDELKKFYADHSQLFRDSGTVSFTHIYFRSDNGDSDAARKKAEDVFKKVYPSTIVRAPQLGDPFPLPSDYSNITQLDAQQNFGVSPFSDSLFSIPVHCWSRPVQSGYGWHLIYVLNRTNAKVPAFDQVKDDALQAWKQDQRNQLNESNYKKLEAQYAIVRKYLDEQ